MSKLINLFVVVLLAGCQSESEQSVLTLQAEKTDFVIAVAAKGELKSAAEITINAPSAVRGTLTVAWLKEENSLVEKGDVIARFDGEESLIRRERAQLELDKIGLTQQNTERTLALDQFTLNQDAAVIDEELAISDRFSTDDLTLYSKNEIIDQFLNKEFLTAKDGYLTWSKTSKTEQGAAQLKVLSLQGEAHSQTISIEDNNLSQLEVRAPQAGILVHAANWRNEKVREGASLWPGSKIASIPDLTQMQAKLFVLETEAAGISEGKLVKLRLDAYPTKTFTGKVASITSIASPKNNDNPVKYFEVLVNLDQTDPSFMKPGQKLAADIIIHQQTNVVTVPNQVIYQKDGEAWVYVQKGDSFNKQLVKLGKRSLTRSELISGVDEGDLIALAKPEQGAE